MIGLRYGVIVLATALLGLFSATSKASTITIGPGTGFDPPSDGFTAGTQGQGQTFVVPIGFPILTEFRFRAGGSVGLDYFFEIYEWEPSHPVQPPIFSQLHEDVSPVDYPWFVGALALQPGSTYLALLREAPAGHNLLIDHKHEDVYPNGEFIVLTDDGFFLPGGAFPHGFGDGRAADALFDATFATAVAEPASLMLVGTGVAALTALRARRRRR